LGDVGEAGFPIFLDSFDHFVLLFLKELWLNFRTSGFCAVSVLRCRG
jgi:hypothetical protein